MSTAHRHSSATRRTAEDGVERLFFGGCSYLGLAHDAHVQAGAERALALFGCSAGAARGTSGTNVLHEQLEAELRDFTGAEACAVLPDAALADLALGLALVRDGARVWCDVDAHPCITDAVRAGGGHVVLGAGDLLDTARADGCTMAFTDGTFPTAARSAPIEGLVRAGFERVIVDDAHGFGLLGERGAGAAERMDLFGERDVLVVALSKVLGAAGGAVLGSRAVVDAVRATSPYACTTGLTPLATGAALEALRRVRTTPSLRERAFANAERLHAIVDTVDPAPIEREILFPVRALMLDDEAATRAVHEQLLAAGIDVPLMRYPGGPGGAYLRLVVTSEHSDHHLERLANALVASV
ncbi:8-amino-7-oxononanoate synthase [Planctomycetes bacterium Pla163]|uniref:8-amino-7-oxononanoate synthase n=1 Tax=Rohdeia mirabilis TaxID=2528008 RepID=A0A518D0T7_9BACT|nr:8-amino-7-oxononanoate synthase [Planctomycetes bacterium Pla163]